MCNAKDDRHIDHSKGSKLVSDACIRSGLIKIETTLKDKDSLHLKNINIYQKNKS